MRLTTNTSPTLLQITKLRVKYTTEEIIVSAVRGIDLEINAGESLAILGESGSGKSVTSRAILGLIPNPPGQVNGSITFEGTEIVGKSDSQLREIRGPGIAMVFQDSLDSLNPVYTVGSQISELLRVRAGLNRKAATMEAERLLNIVGIPNSRERLDDYPHQFSGGMRQRVSIALAVALKPKLLIADEPTTALDVTVQAGVLRMLKNLQRETNMALIFVTHDIGVARQVAERVAVMYAGRIVESGPIEQVLARPAHPYTRALISSHPGAVKKWSDLVPIAGNPPDKSERIEGCAFHPRCVHAELICSTDVPALLEVSSNRKSRCHFAKEVLHGNL